MTSPAHVGSHTICGHCGMFTAVPPGAACDQCSAPLRLLEPLAVDCGWCGSSNRRDLSESCGQCGGPLPGLPGNHPGRAPPATPRALPGGYEDRVRYWKNVYTLLGMIFTICFCWTIIFAAIGIPMWLNGRKRAERKLRALTHGTPSRARILHIETDTSQHINNKSPLAIDYEVELPDRSRRRGRAEAWDHAIARWRVGDVVWVVYYPNEPEVNALWPPVH